MPFQQALWANMLQAWFPGNSTTVQTFGGAVTNVGTISHPALADTNFRTRTLRFVNTSAATAGALASSRPSRTEFARRTGFFVCARVDLVTLQAGMRFFAGITASAASAPTNVDPLANTGAKIGLAINTNTGNLNLIHNAAGAAPTVIDLGASFPVNNTDLWELILFSAPDGASIGYRVRNRTTSVEVSGTLSTNLPAVGTFMGRQIWATNNATAAAVAWGCSAMVAETDN
jgi:hypothetical protein